MDLKEVKFHKGEMRREVPWHFPLLALGGVLATALFNVPGFLNDAAFNRSVRAFNERSHERYEVAVHAFSTALADHGFGIDFRTIDGKQELALSLAQLRADVAAVRSYREALRENTRLAEAEIMDLGWSREAGQNHFEALQAAERVNERIALADALLDYAEKAEAALLFLGQTRWSGTEGGLNFGSDSELREFTSLQSAAAVSLGEARRLASVARFRLRDMEE